MTTSTRRLAAAALLGAMWLVVLAIAALADTIEIEETYRDEFNTQSFSGNDGTADWSTHWKEFGESDGPAAGGVIWVWSSKCSGYCLKIGGVDVDLNDKGVWREANLAGAESATLSFKFSHELLGSKGGKVYLRISPNGGANWTTLETYALNKEEKGFVSRSFDIDDFATGNTRIGFFGSGPNVDAYFRVDDVQIAAIFEVPEPTTTTTTKPPVTITTTTTKPPVTTTTTKPPVTTTTTKPPVTTTTTTTTGAPPATLPPSDDDPDRPTTTTTTQPPTSTTTTTTTTTAPRTGGAGGETPPGDTAEDLAADDRFSDTASLATLALEAATRAPGVELAATFALSPIDYASSSVNIASSTFRSQLLLAFLLGLLIAWLGIRGLEPKDPDSSL